MKKYINYWVEILYSKSATTKNNISKSAVGIANNSCVQVVDDRLKVNDI